MWTKKVPRTLRDQLPVLESGGRVAGAAGLGPDAAFLPAERGEAWHIRLVHPKFGEKKLKKRLVLKAGLWYCIARRNQTC